MKAGYAPYGPSTADFDQDSADCLDARGRWSVAVLDDVEVDAVCGRSSIAWLLALTSTDRTKIKLSSEGGGWS